MYSYQDSTVQEEVLDFLVDGESFTVRVLEDLAQIVDFGPRYNGDEGNSHTSSEPEADQLLEGEATPDEESFVHDTPMGMQGEWRTAVKKQCIQSLRGLEIVAQLNALHNSNVADVGGRSQAKTSVNVIEKSENSLVPDSPSPELTLAAPPTPAFVQTTLSLGDTLVDQRKTANGPTVSDIGNL